MSRPVSPLPTHPASPPPPSNGGLGKLPKFLSRHDRRDRSRSFTDPPPSHIHLQGDTTKPQKLTKKGSKLFSKHTASPAPMGGGPSSSNYMGGRDIVDDRDDFEITDPPVIIEPPPAAPTSTSRPRARSSLSPPLSPSLSSGPRLSDLPSRLSGWFNHTFNTGSSSDLSLPSLLSQSTLGVQVAASVGSTSPKRGNALLTAAKHGKGHIMRYLLDSDSQPDKCTDPIWLMGVLHPGYEPPPPPSPQQSFRKSGGHRRDSTDSQTRRSSNYASHQNPSLQSLASLSGSSSTTVSASKLSEHWPPAFYADFTSRIWCSYRNAFTPIRDGLLSSLEPPVSTILPSPSASSAISESPPAQTKSKWSWGGEKGWTSDSGWGCMLRTGQSLLANALIHVHLSRDWRRPVYPSVSLEYATYVRIITWFLDSPSPQAPFGVHRMALAGRDLGKEVGQWFGPSTAAGAIKRLVEAYPDCGLAVTVASDSVIFETEVFAASHTLGLSRRSITSLVSSPRSSEKSIRKKFGDRPVLILVGLRLGIDGINPIYYETLKTLFSFPQSVGIAGGRPSSSYYFVGSQAGNLFYLDPHHPRPSVPLRPYPPSENTYHHVVDDYNSTDEGHTSSGYGSSRPRRWDRGGTPESDRGESSSSSSFIFRRNGRKTPTSPTSIRSSTSNSANHAPLSPSPLSRSSASPPPARETSVSPIPDSSTSGPKTTIQLDPESYYYATAYPPSEIRTFHCEKVRKTPIAELDPSMLLGFLVRDEQSWKDFRARVAGLAKPFFSIVDEPPSWGDDDSDDMGLESVSDEPDMDSSNTSVRDDFFDSPDYSKDQVLVGASGEVVDEDQEDEVAIAALSTRPVTAGVTVLLEEEDDEEEDFVDHPTPGPTSPTFTLQDMLRPTTERASTDDSWVVDPSPSSASSSGMTSPQNGSSQNGSLSESVAPVLVGPSSIASPVPADSSSYPPRPSSPLTPRTSSPAPKVSSEATASSSSSTRRQHTKTATMHSSSSTRSSTSSSSRRDTQNQHIPRQLNQSTGSDLPFPSSPSQYSPISDGFDSVPPQPQLSGFRQSGGRAGGTSVDTYERRPPAPSGATVTPSSIARAATSRTGKNGGRTTSGGIKGVPWRDSDGDDF